MPEISAPLPCGICRRLAKVGTTVSKIRLTVEDMRDKKYPDPKLPGLYQVCEDCYSEYLPIIAARLGKDVGTMSATDAI